MTPEFNVEVKTPQALEKFYRFVTDTDGIEVLQKRAVIALNLGKRVNSVIPKLDPDLTILDFIYYRQSYLLPPHYKPNPPQEWVNFVNTLTRSEKHLISRSFGQLYAKFGNQTVNQLNGTNIRIYGRCGDFIRAALPPKPRQN